MSLPLLYLDIRGVERDDGTRVQAVRIACDSEVHEQGRPRHESITISAFDDVFNDSLGSTSARSDLSGFIGIPLSARKLPPPATARATRRNVGAAALFRNCDIGATLDPAREPFGTIPDYWCVNTGPIVVARVDKQPLHPLHMAAICAFITRDLGRLFQACKEVEQAWRDQFELDNQQQHQRNPAGTAGRTFTRTAPLPPHVVPLRTRSSASAPSKNSTEPDPALWHIFECRREVLAAATPHRFERFFAKYKRQRRELQLVAAEEVEPRPEWAEVASPLEG